MAKVFFLCNDNWKKQYQKVFFQQNRPDFVKTIDNITNSIGKTGEILPFFADTGLSLQEQNAVWVLAPGILQTPKQIAQTGVAIADSQDSKTLLLLKDSALEVLTCGFSSKDTLSFSSLEDKRCVISLQRGIRTLQNAVVEPFELPMQNPLQLSPFVFLSSCLVCILTGQTKWLQTNACFCQQLEMNTQTLPVINRH